jgi:hypothetical protein
MLGLSALVAAVLTLAANNSALANWWLVRSSDGKCLVVDIEPTEKDKDVTKIGKNVYHSADEAEADAKQLIVVAGLKVVGFGFIWVSGALYRPCSPRCAGSAVSVSQGRPGRFLAAKSRKPRNHQFAGDWKK